MKSPPLTIPHRTRRRTRAASPLTGLLVTALLFLSCASPREPVSFKPAAPEPSDPSLSAYYDLDVQRVFDRSCGPGCHEVDARSGPGIGVRETGLDLTDGRAYESLFGPDGSKNGPLVLPGRPDDSLLYWKVATDPAAAARRFGRRMPSVVQAGRLVDGETLSQAEIGGLRSWIQAGARKTSVPLLPPLTSAASLDARTLEVTFADALAGTAAELVRRYTATAPGGRTLSLVSATASGSRTVRLTTLEQAAGITYTLAAYGVRGTAGTVTFRYTPPLLQVTRATPVDSVTLEVGFSEPVDPVTAAQPARYAIQGLSVQSAGLAGADAVRLKTSGQKAGVTYTVVVSGVLSLRGGSLQAGQADRAAFQYLPPVSFSVDVQPIFNRSCALAGCHAGAGASFGLRLEAGQSYGGLVGVRSGIKPSLNRVQPSDPDNSLLVQKLEGAPGIGSRMPLGGALRDSEIQSIRLWIAGGARDN